MRGLAALVTVGVLAAPSVAYGHAVRIDVLSSRPDQVSGGDALVRVQAPPGLLKQLRVERNCVDVTPAFAQRDGALVGLVDGLEVGRNVLTAGHQRHVDADLGVTNFPITGPMFSGPQQHPFVCTTNQLGLQPKVDAAAEPGYAVRDAANAIVGYSRNCSIDTVVSYLYRASNNSWKPLPADGSTPADMTQTTLPDGRIVDFVVRREVGSINRFLYSFAMLAPRGSTVRERVSTGFFGATGLPIIVAVTALGVDAGDLDPGMAASLVGAGLLSVLIFPLVGLTIRTRQPRRPRQESNLRPRD